MPKTVRNLTDKITNYITYLSSGYHLNISLHLYYEFAEIFHDLEALRQFNNHYNPYCMFVKSTPENYEKCRRCQKFVLQKCQLHESYTGVCHAGVKEIIYTVKYSEKAVGFVSISGYAASDGHFRTADPKYDYYRSYLSKDAPPETLCSILIPPLIIMLENLCEYWHTAKQDAIPVTDTNHSSNVLLLNYISDHYTHLSLCDLAAAFHRSPSAISHSFKRDNGITLKSYCNQLKINDAKALLQSSDLPVTEIAYAVGFESLSYFINVFKKHTGYSPREYRKLYKEA